MREHSVRLYRFRIISLDRRTAVSKIMVRFTKSDEKEVLSSATCVAIMCSHKDKWAAAFGKLLKQCKH